MRLLKLIIGANVKGFEAIDAVGNVTVAAYEKVTLKMERDMAFVGGRNRSPQLVCEDIDPKLERFGWYADQVKYLGNRTYLVIRLETGAKRKFTINP